MPSSAVVAGGIAGILAIAALGVGLGIGLNRNNEDPATEDATEEAASEAGTRGVEAGATGAEVPSETDPTFAFAPSRAFGPESDPLAAGPTALDVGITGANGVLPPAPGVAAPVPSLAPAPVPMTALAPALVSVEVPESVEDLAPAPSDEELIDTESGAVDTSGIAPGPDGKYAVCPGSWEEREFPAQPCGVTVNADGSVQLGEYFGGFDGFFSVDPADGHENCLSFAVAMMFQQEFCEIEDEECVLGEEEETCVCYAEDKENPPANGLGWPGNVGIVKFLTDLRDIAGPEDWDYPEDYEIANNGGRTDNQALVEAVFEDLITVGSC